MSDVEVTVTPPETFEVNVYEGAKGEDGVGIPAGGSTGKILAKASGADYDTEWVSASVGGGAPAWGDITGTLADQSDLASALAGKLSSAANQVTNAKLAQMATSTIKGNVAVGTADPADLTVAQVKTLLGLTGTNSGDVSVGAVGSTPSANGASVSGQVITLQPASATLPGVLTAGAQGIGGVKTLADDINTKNIVPVSAFAYNAGSFSFPFGSVYAGGMSLLSSGQVINIFAPTLLASKNWFWMPADGAVDDVVVTDASGGLFMKPVTNLFRSVTHADATSISVNSATTDQANQVNTQAGGTLTINAPSGSPVNGRELVYRIKSTNAQTFSWNAIFRGSVSGALPSTTSGGGLTDYYTFKYNSTDAKWDFIQSRTGF